METASLLLMVSGLGISFGWQPLPDDSPRYEYIVQLEPELVATLEAGHSIPITSDIPEEIGPIGRIRIVIGRDELPHDKLVTRLKPLVESSRKKSRDGILETQHVVPSVESGSGNRYDDPQILPPNSNADNNSDAFARALQEGARQARNQPNGNAAPQTSNILPSSAGQRLADHAEKTTESVGDHLRNPGQSVRADVEQLFGGNQQSRESSILRQGSNLSQSGGTAPKYDGQNTRSSSSILPPDSSRPTPVGTAQILPLQPRIDQPIEPGRARNWKQSKRTDPHSIADRNRPTHPAAISPRGVFDAPWPPIVRYAEQASPPSQSPPTPPINGSTDRFVRQQPPSSQAKTRIDPFDIANRDREQDPQLAGRYPPEMTTADSLSFPGREDATTASGVAISQKDGGTWPPITSGAPEIRREMLDQSSRAKLQTAGIMPSSMHTSGYGTDAPSQTNMQSSSRQQTGAGNSSSGTTSVFPLLLSWVLLSGSGAGNLYLFWSYLDIRSKYRGLVHNAGRRGERYSSVDD